MVHANKSRPAVALLSRGMSTVPLAGEMPRIPPKKRDFAAEVAALKQWWSSDRFAETKRNYTAEARASASSTRRGAIHTHPPSLLPARRTSSSSAARSKTPLPLARCR